MTWAVRQELPALQKLVLLMLANRTNPDTGRCDPSHERLATDCGMSKTAVKNALSSLRDAGKIEVIHRSADGVNLPNHYRLLMPIYGATLPGGVGRETTHPAAGAQGDGVGRETPGGESPDAPGVGRETPTKRREETKKKKEEGEGQASNPKDLTFDFELGVFVGPIGDLFGRWSKAFPAIDPEAEVAKAAAWLYANPANRKSNYVRFLTNWMSRAQDKAPRRSVPPPSLFGAEDYDRIPPRRPSPRGNPSAERADFMDRLTGRDERPATVVIDV